VEETGKYKSLYGATEREAYEKLQKDFYILLENAGLPQVRIHDLRHTASTLLQSMGVNPRVVQEILGHSNLEQTGDYTHVLLSMQKDASEKMDILFQKPS
jgi:integrase